MKKKSSLWKRVVAITVLLSLIIVALCSGVALNTETKEYTKSWLKKNNVFPEGDASYYLIDNPSWFADHGVENAFAISYDFNEDDWHMEYDVGGVKLGYYYIDDQDYGYTEFYEDEDVTFVLSGDSLSSSSVFTKDTDLLKEILATNLSKSSLEQKDDIDGYAVVEATADEYEMILYINKDTKKCERFEYIDKESDNESFKCYITESSPISLPDDFYDKLSSEEMTIDSFADESSSFITGAMYMLQWQTSADESDNSSTTEEETEETNNTEEPIESGESNEDDEIEED